MLGPLGIEIAAALAILGGLLVRMLLWETIKTVFQPLYTRFASWLRGNGNTEEMDKLECIEQKVDRLNDTAEDIERQIEISQAVIVELHKDDEQVDNDTLRDLLDQEPEVADVVHGDD